ncbi:MAG TPA: D-alanyl-D-alanine carboxypeptidase, partial [Flavisolibacter sp.]
MRFFWLTAFTGLLFTSCSITKKLERSARTTVLQSEALQTAHVGIAVYEPASEKYWYNYQGDKYFVPASNTKIPTCYAAMKYLGDSLVGLRYQEHKNSITVFPTADPTFLHPEFSNQPAFEFFKSESKVALFLIDTINKIWREQHLGNGWAWNDYNEPYMAERSPMPIYGNLVNVRLLADSFQFVDFMKNETNLVIEPKFFKKKFFEHRFERDQNFYFKRWLQTNQFEMEIAQGRFKSQSIPFANNSIDVTLSLLEDTLKDYLYDKMILRMDQEAKLKKTEYIRPEKQTFKPFYR